MMSPELPCQSGLALRALLSDHHNHESTSRIEYGVPGTSARPRSGQDNWFTPRAATTTSSRAWARALARSSYSFFACLRNRFTSDCRRVCQTGHDHAAGTCSNLQKNSASIVSIAALRSFASPVRYLFSLIFFKRVDDLKPEMPTLKVNATSASNSSWTSSTPVTLSLTALMKGLRSSLKVSWTFRVSSRFCSSTASLGLGLDLLLLVGLQLVEVLPVERLGDGGLGLLQGLGSEIGVLVRRRRPAWQVGELVGLRVDLLLHEGLQRMSSLAASSMKQLHLSVEWPEGARPRRCSSRTSRCRARRSRPRSR